MYEDQETKTLTPVLGENPKGYQIATPRRPLAGAGDAVGSRDSEDRPGARPGVCHA